ncbi:HAD family hydrolase [Pseudofrankia inefficax]|uniref:HAD-superfamily hydrolase, subfamily IA, variant 3 n=1 Tax=Pseudofrankia inefficax (strain DSM 45817 / CECT 9037 / DDB 130130 / EuI1c) TaxID=298654 RepID=E3J2V8_PSEI1|nr:HAD-superfamily hydrolase, subfamily IA, variant 3 [Pseudofrankia inefficax]
MTAAETPATETPAWPAAVLLDMDGLLVDTEHLWTISEEELAARYGREFTPRMKQAMVGHGIDTAVPLMLSMLGVDADPADAGRFLVERTVELFRTPGLVERRPGAPELLARLAEAGVATALVSSSFRSLMDPVLDTLGREFFTVTVAGDEVARRKPYPDPYLIAAAALGVDPARCVVLEDSTTGALAGLRAGCVTVLVPSMPNLPTLAEVAANTEAALAATAAPGPGYADTVELADRLLRAETLHDVTPGFLAGLVPAAT